MWRVCVVALCLLTLTVVLTGCGEKTPTYEWQRPHDTYRVGSFTNSRQAEALRAKLQRNGYSSRVATAIDNGQFVLNVLVDIYTFTPDTLSQLERISGSRPVPLKSTKTGDVSKDI